MDLLSCAYISICLDDYGDVTSSTRLDVTCFVKAKEVRSSHFEVFLLHISCFQNQQVDYIYVTLLETRFEIIK
jgi:hypothetical protein